MFVFRLNNIIKSADLTHYTVTSHPCPTCDETITTTVEPQQLFAYNQGAFAQVVLPHLSLDDRERFISGYCAPCWDKLFDGVLEEVYDELETDIDEDILGVELDPEPVVISDDTVWAGTEPASQLG